MRLDNYINEVIHAIANQKLVVAAKVVKVLRAFFNDKQARLFKDGDVRVFYIDFLETDEEVDQAKHFLDCFGVNHEPCGSKLLIRVLRSGNLDSHAHLACFLRGENAPLPRIIEVEEKKVCHCDGCEYARSTANQKSGLDLRWAEECAEEDDKLLAKVEEFGKRIKGDIPIAEPHREPLSEDPMCLGKLYSSDEASCVGGLDMGVMRKACGFKNTCKARTESALVQLRSGRIQSSQPNLQNIRPPQTKTGREVLKALRERNLAVLQEARKPSLKIKIGRWVVLHISGGYDVQEIINVWNDMVTARSALYVGMNAYPYGAIVHVAATRFDAEEEALRLREYQTVKQ